MNSIQDEKMDSYHYILSVPLALGGAIFKVSYFLIWTFLLPFRFIHWFLTTWPILSCMILLFVLGIFLLARRLSRQSTIHYFLYTAIPYAFSIVYTGVTFVFPQVHVVTRICAALLHPIRYILGFIERIDRRAAPIRRTVEALVPPKNGKSNRRSIEEKLNEDRLQCCICVFKEKNVILRPCMHLCLCDGCLEAFLRHQNNCPICRAPIDGYDKVFL